MRKNKVGPLSVGMFLLAATVVLAAPPQGTPRMEPMSLTTSAFSDGGQIPSQYGCDVAQGAPMVSPELTWTNVPKNAVTLTLIMHDLDANPQKGIMDVTHWTVYNIPASAMSLPEGVKPGTTVDESGEQGKNIRGVDGYQAPCPPKGGPAHHYIFELYALDTKLDLPAGAPRADILKAMDGHIIGKASYTGKFSH